MPLTTAQQKEALEHLIVTVLNKQADDPMALAFNWTGIVQPDNLFIHDSALELLEYKDSSNNIVPLSRAQISTVKQLRDFFPTQNSQQPWPHHCCRLENFYLLGILRF